MLITQPLTLPGQGRREPQRGPGKHSGGAPLGRKFLTFYMAHSRVLYIFERRRAPKRREVRGNLLRLPLPPVDGPAHHATLNFTRPRLFDM